MGLLNPGPDLASPPRLTPAPGRNRVYVIPLIVLALLGGYMFYLITRPDPPVQAQALPTPSATSIEQLVAVGPRGPSCLRLIIGLDVSGSMSDFDEARDLALAEIVRWSAGNLKDNDEIAIVDFAEEARVRLKPTTIAKHPTAGVAPGAADGPYTMIQPVWDVLASFPKTTCDSALVLLSDGKISDLPADAAAGDRALTRAGVHDVRLLVPGQGITVFPGWELAFPTAPPDSFDGMDAGRTGIIIGETIVGLTGQSLAARSTPSPIPS